MSDDTPRAAWPDGFVWGTSTSSYQIEGAAAVDGRGASIWDTYSRLPGKVANGDTGDVACDHYHRYREDVALMRSLGVDAYRFSVAWSRVLPSGRGEVNPKGLAFYDRLTDELMTAGIEPWLCLYHWDLPQAIQDTGGWGTRDTAGWFEDYAALMTRRLGDRVKRWATFNEFSVFTLFGYAMDWAPPGRSDRDAHLQAIHHVNLAHGAGVEVIRSGVPGARIGAIHNRQPVIAVNDTEADRAAAAMLDTHWNQVFPEAQLGAAYPAAIAQAIESHVRPGDMARICRPIDWIGLNHYGPIFARADERSPWGFAWADAPDGDERTEIGWSIRPDLFRDELIELSRRYRLPVYVTENGCGGTDGPAADGSVDDPARIRYLDRYTDAMREAIGRGADVRGYFVWSLLDNFEWGAGYGNRFGLVHVDYASQKRTPKSSARWYARLIAASRRSLSHAPPAS